jgi:hypothetical protein
MRTVLIRIETAKPRIHKLHLREGTRVSDILRHLNVPEGYGLALASHPTRPLPQEAEVHALVADADHLIARSNLAAVGNATTFTLNLCK